MKYKIIFSGEVELEAFNFFGDEAEDGDYSLEAAAESLRQYVEDNGVAETLNSWGLDDCLKLSVEGPVQPVERKRIDL